MYEKKYYIRDTPINQREKVRSTQINRVISQEHLKMYNVV